MGEPEMHLVKSCGNNGSHCITPLTQFQKRKQWTENKAVAISRMMSTSKLSESTQRHTNLISGRFSLN